MSPHPVFALLASLGCGPPDPQLQCDGAIHPRSEPTHEAPRSFDPWDLWLQGSLRGANIYQRRTYPKWDDNWNGPGDLGPPIERSDLLDLRAQGANFANLSIPGLLDEQPPYRLCPSIERHLDELLEDVAAADLFAVLSIRTGPGRNDFTLIGPPRWSLDEVWEDEQAQDAWVEMWTYIADRYRNHPTVVGYDLMVEPNANEVLADEFEPGPFYREYGGTLADWNVLADRIAAGIRQVDPSTPIIAGAASYSAVPWLPWMDAGDHDRIVYGVHQYAPIDYTHQYDGDIPCAEARYPGDPCTREQFEQYFEPIAERIDAGSPVVVNELGGVRYVRGLPDFLGIQLDLLDELGASHAVWQWGSEHPPQRSNDDFNIRHGTDRDHHRVTDDNPLLDVFRASWAANSVFPSALTSRRSADP